MVLRFCIVVELCLIQPAHRVMRGCAIRLLIEDAFVFLKGLRIIVVLDIGLGLQVELFRICVHVHGYSLMITGINYRYVNYHPSTHAKISGATIVASLSTINFGVWISNLPQVIFSFGTAPE